MRACVCMCGGVRAFVCVWGGVGGCVCARARFTGARVCVRASTWVSAGESVSARVLCFKQCVSVSLCFV